MQEQKDGWALQKSFLWLLTFMKPHIGWMIAGIVSAIAAAVIEVWTGSLIQNLTAQADHGTRQFAVRLVLTIFAIILVGVPAKYFMAFGTERSSALTMKDIRDHLMSHIGKLPVHYLERQHSGDMLSRSSNDLQMIQQFMVRDLAQWFYHPPLFIGRFVYLIWIQWRLVLFSLLLVPVSLLVSHWVGKQMERLTEEAQSHMGRMNAIVQDTLGGMPVVKSYLLSGSLFRSFESYLQLTLQKKLAVHKREAWIDPLLFTLMLSPIIFSVIYGSYLISRGQFGAGELIAFLYLLNLCLEPLGHIPTLVTNTFQMTGALKRITEILKRPAENQEGHPIPRTDHPPIVFNNVTFAYDHKPPVLRNLSFTVPEGKTIALIGASGGEEHGI
ncbi:ABC transporter ATP-binding protein/permease [Paenibacillus sp. P26]|nr:ABC transporter ATP-binding protein/permease [Paenibacillus sp. P26]